MSTTTTTPVVTGVRINVDADALLDGLRAGDTFVPVAPLTSLSTTLGTVTATVDLDAIAGLADSRLAAMVTSYGPGHGDSKAGLELAGIRLTGPTPDELANTLAALSALVYDGRTVLVGPGIVLEASAAGIGAAALARMSDAVRTVGITYGDAHQHTDELRQRVTAQLAAFDATEDERLTALFGYRSCPHGLDHRGACDACLEPLLDRSAALALLHAIRDGR